ncbi:MAG: prephenate dehydrogenase/arogenate dehydrogenase family protein, partial [bacterium]
MKKIAIIGFGRFGRLLAEILKSAGVIHVVSTSGQSGNFQLISKEQLIDMDWIVPAVPISALRLTLIELVPFIRPGALIFDVSSVKVMPCQWLIELVPENIEVVGTHPMFGPDSAKNGLTGLQIVLCPLRQTEKTLFELKDLFLTKGLKIIETTPEDHDRQAANCLSLVHFLGRGLQRLVLSDQEISTMGFERLLKVNETVSNDTWQLFLDMQIYNP